MKIIEEDLIFLTEKGLYCNHANVYIDPWTAVEKSLNTHAHRDHISYGCKSYLCSKESEGVMRLRLGKDSKIESLSYGEKIKIGEVYFTFYPAGHIIGSSQILIEYKGKKLIITGDYKRQSDESCTQFEIVKCHTLITECTFGLPVFKWPSIEDETNKILKWWEENRSNKITSIIYAYPLGKSQRLMSLLSKYKEKIYIHNSIVEYVKEYEKYGVIFPEYEVITQDNLKDIKNTGLVICPSGFQDSNFSKKLFPISEADASGWVNIRGIKKRRSIDKGFIISDHVDWSDLKRTIIDTNATKVIFTHGFSDICKRYFSELGLETSIIPNRSERHETIF